MKLYNTLTRKKEEFVPINSPVVSTYSCGPTVYNYAHIGNLRTYVFMDLLRRVLKYNGYKTKSVMNITDVGHLVSDGDDGEDKMQKTAREERKSPEEIAAYYTEVFMKDLARLNILKPEIIPKATDNIDVMIAYVQKLLESGNAYETSDGIYFDVSTFDGYGKLSGQKLDDKDAGARVEVNDEKRHPADFALWKKAEPNHIMQWDSPWGKGYPGWHIECSAMGKRYLGDRFDIHTGGVDHIPIHHENEIAQSECYEGHQTVNYWMHGEFIQVDGGKMSKSLGNTYTIDNLIERGYAPLDFRYFCLNTHYRKKLNFTFDAISAAKTAHNRLIALITANRNAPSNNFDTAPYLAEFKAAIDDDLNVPLALGVLWNMLKNPPCKEIYTAALEFDKVLGLSLDTAKPEIVKTEIPPEIEALAEERLQARKNKDWAESDRLRDEISNRGYAIKDTKDGYELTRKA